MKSSALSLSSVNNGDRSCRSVRKEAQESEGGMWDVGRGKDSAHMRDHRDDDHVDVDDDDRRFERRCVLPCEKLPRFCVSFLCSSLNDLLCWGFTSLHFTSSRR